MEVGHAGARILHYGRDPFPHVRTIAMYGAFRALRLVVPKGASFKASCDIRKKLSARWAQVFFRAMVPTAEDSNHQFGRSDLLLHFCVIPWHEVPGFLSAQLQVSLCRHARPCLSSGLPPGRMVSFRWIFPSWAGYRSGARTRRQRQRAELTIPS